MLFKKKEQKEKKPNKLKLWLDRFIAKRALNKYLKKQIAELNKIQERNKSLEPEDVGKQFNDSYISLKKIIDYCKQQNIQTKEQWEKAGIPMKLFVKNFLSNSRKYAELKIKEAKAEEL